MIKEDLFFFKYQKVSVEMNVKKNSFEYELHIPLDMGLRDKISVFSNISRVRFIRILQIDDTLHFYISIDSRSYVKDKMNHFEVELPILVGDVKMMVIHSFRDVSVRIVDNKYQGDCYKYLLSIYATDYTYTLNDETYRSLGRGRGRERERSYSRERDYDRDRDRDRSRSRSRGRGHERSYSRGRERSTKPPPPSTPAPTKAPVVHMGHYHPQPMVPYHPHPDPQMRYVPYYPPYEDMRKY